MVNEWTARLKENFRHLLHVTERKPVSHQGDSSTAASRVQADLLAADQVGVQTSNLGHPFASSGNHVGATVNEVELFFWRGGGHAQATEPDTLENQRLLKRVCLDCSQEHFPGCFAYNSRLLVVCSFQRTSDLLKKGPLKTK